MNALRLPLSNYLPGRGSEVVIEEGHRADNLKLGPTNSLQPCSAVSNSFLLVRLRSLPVGRPPTMRDVSTVALASWGDSLDGACNALSEVEPGIVWEKPLSRIARFGAIGPTHELELMLNDDPVRSLTINCSYSVGPNATVRISRIAESLGLSAFDPQSGQCVCVQPQV